MRLSIAVLAIALGASAGIMAQAVPIVSSARAETHTEGRLTVTSAGFQENVSIPARYSAYGENISPQVEWSPVAGAQSYALVVEDPDAKSPTPVLHWIVWNIPSSVTALPEGLSGSAANALVQGRNTKGTNGYMGPHPPLGDPPHHYHFQVFALDRMLMVAAGADIERFLAAANGHVVAKGELIGLYQQPVQASK